MREQVQQLEGVLIVCILQSIVEEEGQQKFFIPRNIDKCSLVFGHSEAFHYCVAKTLKEKTQKTLTEYKLLL